MEEEGITGAIDLAWYYPQVFDSVNHRLITPLPPQILDLAQKAKLDATSLAATIERLSEDTQVQYIWALYNNFTEFSGGQEKSVNGKDDGKA
jgi:hypothetical protein